MDLPSDSVTAEDVSLQQVLEASMQDPVSPTHQSQDDKASTPTGSVKMKGKRVPKIKPDESPPRYTIDDCIRDLNVSQTHIFSINDTHGDTYVYMDPPSQQPGQSEQNYSAYCKQYERPFLMQSEKLARMSTLFKEMLGPTQQFRTIRRRKLAGSLPPGIKYVLDITPPSEGDDAVYLTASLCCSEGVRFWHLVGDEFDISDQLIGGKEDWIEDIPERHEGALEYSPIRHRAAIEQCLAAMQGHNIELNSAVKVWSIAIMLEYFGITSHECTFLTDCIVTWLGVEPNNHFLEINSEESLRIATILQNPNLTRDVFALLVGEETLDCLIRQRTGLTKSSYSMSGRKKEALPESWVERVEYATKSFLQSHSRDVDDLFANDLRWIDKIFAFQVPQDNDRDPELEKIYQQLLQALKNYTQVMLLACLFDEQSFGIRTQPNFTKLRSEKRRPKSKSSTEGQSLPIPILKQSTPISERGSIASYSDLFPFERTLTRNFWEKLRMDMQFRQGFYADSLWQRLPNEFHRDVLVQKVSPSAHENATLGAIEDIIKDGQLHLRTMPLHLPVKIEGQTQATVPSTPGDRASQSFDAWFNDFPQIVLPDDRVQQDSETEAIDLYGQPPAPLLSVASPIPEESVNLVGPRVPNQSQQSRAATPPAVDHVAQSEFWCPSDSLRPTHLGRIFFNLENFWKSVDFFIADFARAKLAWSDADKRFDALNPRLTNTLVCLGENEWKYLPLWADGLDDETGAIYSEDVMEAAPGSDFSTPGPNIHMGTSTWSSSSGGSDYDMMSDAGSCDTSINLSTAVADGHSDQLFRGKVYTPSSAGTLDSIDQEMASHVEEERARLVVRSVERAQKIKVEETEEVDSKVSSKTTDDTCYDDLFSGDGMEEDGYESDGTERGAGEHTGNGSGSDDEDEEADDDDGGVLV